MLAVGRFRGTLPAQITLWGMEPASIEVGTPLAPTIEAALDDPIHAVAEDLGATPCQPILPPSHEAS